MKLLQSLFLATVLLFSNAVFADKININSANAEQISEGMIGIGASKAKAIVDYRIKHGKFKTLQALENVAGIGAKTIEKNKDNISL